MDNNYKYFKYKIKYLKLKKIIGGELDKNLINKNLIKIINNFIQRANNMKKQLYTKYSKDWDIFKISDANIKFGDKITNYIKMCNETDINMLQQKFSNEIAILKKIILEKLGIQPSKIDWFKLSSSNLINYSLYIIREYLVCLVLCTACIINDKIANIKTKSINININNKCILINDFANKHFEIGKYFIITISGSELISSDIDVNITTFNLSSFWMEVIEELIESIEWFNHFKWRVDFYGDFTSFFSLTNINNNTYTYPILKYKIKTKIQLLIYSVISFFKHHNSNKFTEYESILNQLCEIFIEYNFVDLIEEYNVVDLIEEYNVVDLKEEYNVVDLKEEKEIIRSKIIRYGKNVADKIKNFILNDHIYRENRVINNNTDLPKSEHQIQSERFRQNYYQNALNIDKYITEVKKNPNIFSIDDLSILITKANLYREENYLLFDSIIHIVTCPLSSKNNTDLNIITDIKIDSNNQLFKQNSCDILFIENYILSIIEQFGFMIHNLIDNEDEICNLTANKYFNRILKALEQIKIIIHNQIPNSNLELNIFDEDLKKAKKISDNISCLKINRSTNTKTLNITNCYIKNYSTENYSNELCKFDKTINNIDLIKMFKKLINQLSKLLKIIKKFNNTV